jgi:hypothetical protein
MADFIVLEKFAGVVGGRPTRYAPGTILSNRFIDIEALRSEGCALAYYDAATMSDARDAYLKQYGPGRNELIGMTAILEANDALPSSRLRSVAQEEPTGFVDRSSSTISFDNATRTFTLSPVGDSIEAWSMGSRILVEQTKTIQISDVEGLHFITLQIDGELHESTVFSEAIIVEEAFVAVVYWDVSAGARIYFGEERHGVNMTGRTHLWLHIHQGSQWISGLGLGGITADDTGNDDSHAQFACSDGQIRDEDLAHSIADGVPQDLAPICTLPIYYKSGAGDWNRTALSTFPVRSFVGGSGLIAWNEFTGGAWQQTEVANNDYVLAHIFATNDIENPIIAIQGQATYATVVTARQGATEEIANLVTAGLPFAEFVPIGTIIFQTANAYGNTVKGRIRTTDLGANYVDFRKFRLGSTGTVAEHGNLSGLTDDDHPQYLLRSEIRSGIITAVGAGDQVVSFAAIGGDLPSTSYVVSVTCEDNGSGVGTFVIKNGTIAVGGFTLTVGGAAKYHWRAELIT